MPQPENGRRQGPPRFATPRGRETTRVPVARPAPRSARNRSLSQDHRIPANRIRADRTRVRGRAARTQHPAAGRCSGDSGAAHRAGASSGPDAGGGRRPAVRRGPGARCAACCSCGAWSCAGERDGPFGGQRSAARSGVDSTWGGSARRDPARHPTSTAVDEPDPGGCRNGTGRAGRAVVGLVAVTFDLNRLSSGGDRRLRTPGSVGREPLPQDRYQDGEQLVGRLHRG